MYSANLFWYLLTITKWCHDSLDAWISLWQFLQINFVTFVEVLWCIGVFTWLSRWEPGFESQHRHALLSFSKAIYPHCCSRPRCINGDPVGCDRWLCLNLQAPLSQAAIPDKECSRGVEIVHCKCGIEMYPMTGVIIICCKRFGPYGKSAYKN